MAIFVQMLSLQDKTQKPRAILAVTISVRMEFNDKNTLDSDFILTILIYRAAGATAAQFSNFVDWCNGFQV